MVLRTSAAKWLTSDDAIPAPSEPLNVTAVAAFSIREKHSRVGIAADAASFVSNPASAALEMTKPRLVRRLASNSRPRDKRLATVPVGQLRVWAASLIDRPSSAHSTTGARYLSGNWLSSRSSKSLSSAWTRSWEASQEASDSSAHDIVGIRRRALALSDVRWATP